MVLSVCFENQTRSAIILLLALLQNILRQYSDILCWDKEFCPLKRGFLYSEVKMYWYNRNWKLSFIERCYIFGVSFIRGSPVE